MGYDNDLETGKYRLKKYAYIHYMHIIAKIHTKFCLRGLQAFLSHRAVPSEDTQQYQMLKLSQRHTKTQGLETETTEI